MLHMCNNNYERNDDYHIYKKSFVKIGMDVRYAKIESEYKLLFIGIHNFRRDKQSIDLEVYKQILQVKEAKAICRDINIIYQVSR